MARRTRAGREGRMAARKAATASEAIWPGMAGGRYRPLSDADLDKVHAAALTILEKTGIGEPLDELLDEGLAQGRLPEPARPPVFPPRAGGGPGRRCGAGIRGPRPRQPARQGRHPLQPEQRLLLELRYGGHHLRCGDQELSGLDPGGHLRLHPAGGYPRQYPDDRRHGAGHRRARRFRARHQHGLRRPGGQRETRLHVLSLARTHQAGAGAVRHGLRRRGRVPA